jgi:predicted RNA methylase
MSQIIDYDHGRNSHSPLSPAVVLPELFKQNVPSSVLDVGCGCGTWIKAALDIGVTDIVGIDGAKLSADYLCGSY